MQRKIIVAALACITSFASAQRGEKAINSQQMVKDILTLSADSLQGREPCTIGETRTIAYLKSRMKEIGLLPAFGKSYTQAVPLVSIRSLLPNTVKVSTKGGEFSLRAGLDYTAWSPTTKHSINLKNSPLIFVGFGVNAPESQWNDFKKMDVKGKTIVVLVNDPGFYNHDTTLFKGKAMTYYGRWRYKFEEAERRGAAACLIIHNESGAGYPWSVVDKHTNGTEFYIDEPTLAKRQCMVNGWITEQAANELLAQAGYQLSQLKDAAAKRSFSPIDLKSTISISIKNEFKRCKSMNVAGYIKGRKYPNEVIVYTGHWDHLGITTPIEGDSICHGASDNASAISWMFGIAKAFKTGPAPERSILFLSPTAEESGLLGSEYYVKHPRFPMSKTVAIFNTDVFVFLGKFKDVTVTGLGHSQLDEMLTEAAATQGRYVTADPTPENGMFYRSDQQPFLKAGVPALFAKGYVEAIDLGKENTALTNAEYWKTVYHKPTDRFIVGRSKIDGVYEDAILFYRLGNKLANSRIFPKWKAGSEFYRKR